MRKQTQIFLFIIISIVIVAYNNFTSSKSAIQHTIQAKSQNISSSKDSQVDNTQNFKMSWPKDIKDDAAISDQFGKNFYLILDGSGSMDDRECSDGRRKIDVAKIAMKNFVNDIDPMAKVGLFAFDFNGVKERVALGKNNRDLLKSEIDKIRDGGRTPLGQSLKFAYEKLTQEGRKQLGYGEYHIVVLTDGISSDTSLLVESVSEIIKKSPVVIHTIGFCIGENHTLNQPGKTYYKAANDPKSLSAGLGDVLAESESFKVLSFE